MHGGITIQWNAWLCYDYLRSGGSVGGTPQSGTPAGRSIRLGSHSSSVFACSRCFKVDEQGVTETQRREANIILLSNVELLLALLHAELVLSRHLQNTGSVTIFRDAESNDIPLMFVDSGGHNVSG